MSEEIRIQELLQRDVYVGETLVGKITGERFHPRDECVQSVGVVVRTHFTVRDRYNLPEIIIIPVAQLGRTTARLDEVILRCSTKRLVTLPTYLKLNHPDYEDE